jgi:hypothetical protein
MAHYSIDFGTAQEFRQRYLIRAIEQQGFMRGR